MKEKPIILKVLRVDQPLGEFYIGAIDSKDLKKISYTEIRQFESGQQATLAGIQREKSAARVKKLSEYVNFDFATFPTSVTLAVDEKSVDLEPVDKKEKNPQLFNLVISSFEGDEENPPIPIEESAFIIDGQHRLAGLENLDEGRTFEVNVSIFVGIDVPDKAEIFSIVNLAQSKVNRSLSFDLFSYAEDKSPHKFAHEVVVALNVDELGPFFQKIKRLGKATPGLGKRETLAQATVVDSILRYISTNPDRERNNTLSGIFNRSVKEGDLERFPFLNFYDDDKKVELIRLLTNYFTSIQHKWGDCWIEPRKDYILNRTTGFNALMRFLKPLLISIDGLDRVVSKSEFDEIFSDIDIKQNELRSDIFLPGSSGASKLYNRLLKEANI